jgi:predicted DNA-binding transcriptional regulator AlpA
MRRTDIPATVDGRPVISRADMVARGVSRQSLYLWYRERANNGFPEVAGRNGRTDYWYEDDWNAWLESHLQVRVGTLTQVNRGGDPDELVDAEEAAQIMGYASPSASRCLPRA